MHFSLLMSLYAQEIPTYFHRSMQSIWDEQTCKPSEIVLVLDGELTEALYRSIEIWEIKLGDVFKTIPLEKNVGLGKALQTGLSHCHYELVARMDTDDIAYADRFEQQVKILTQKDIDVCGAWVSEFEEDENTMVSCRKVPQWHEEIFAFAKKRNPMNHPAVMYKKSTVLTAGGYHTMLWFEDYDLWARMLLQGAKFYNIQTPLVKMRAGYRQLERRQGLQYAMHEMALEKALFHAGFLNWYEYLRNTVFRFFVRIIPQRIVKQVYRYLRTHS